MLIEISHRVFQLGTLFFIARVALNGRAADL